MKMINAVVVILLMCSRSSLAGTESGPDLVLTGVITHADNHMYREVPFTVPSGIIRLAIEFSYTTKE